MKGGKTSSKQLKAFIDASYDKSRPEEIDGFKLDKELSKATGAVYHNPITKETKLIHRGTSGAKDWANNAMYAVGLYEHTNRYKKGKKLQERAEAKYGNEQTDTLSHSQGSILANKLGKNTKNIINLNPAYKGEATGKNVTNIRSSNDVVSALLKPANAIRNIFGKKSKGKTVTIKADSINPLKEHSTDILDRTDEMYGMGRRQKVEHLKAQGIRVRKAMGRDEYEVRVSRKVLSVHPTKKEAVKAMLNTLSGGGFFSDFGRGFVRGFTGTADLASGAMTGNPEKMKEGFNTITAGSRKVRYL